MPILEARESADMISDEMEALLLFQGLQCGNDSLAAMSSNALIASEQVKTGTKHSGIVNCGLLPCQECKQKAVLPRVAHPEEEDGQPVSGAATLQMLGSGSEIFRRQIWS